MTQIGWEGLYRFYDRKNGWWVAKTMQPKFTQWKMASPRAAQGRDGNIKLKTKKVIVSIIEALGRLECMLPN